MHPRSVVHPTPLPHIDVVVGVDKPLLAVELVSISTRREDVLTCSLRPHTWAGAGAGAGVGGYRFKHNILLNT